MTEHSLIIKDRSETTVGGVTDVECFDQKNVCVYTERGMMSFRGDGFEVTVLSLETGEISFRGRVDSVKYSSDVPKKNESLLARLFR